MGENQKAVPFSHFPSRGGGAATRANWEAQLQVRTRWQQQPTVSHTSQPTGPVPKREDMLTSEHVY